MSMAFATAVACSEHWSHFTRETPLDANAHDVRVCYQTLAMMAPLRQPTIGAAALVVLSPVALARTNTCLSR